MPKRTVLPLLYSLFLTFFQHPLSPHTPAENENELITEGFIFNQIANDEHNNEVAQTVNVVNPKGFKSYTDDEIDKFIFVNENENTRKKPMDTSHCYPILSRAG